MSCRLLDVPPLRPVLLGLLVVLVSCGSPTTPPNDPKPGDPQRTTVDPADYHEVPPPGTETREVTFTLPGTTEVITAPVYVMDGFYVHEGDIIVGKVGAEGALSNQAAALPWQNSLWPNGVVPYKIDASLLEDGEGVGTAQLDFKKEIGDAVAHWNTNTNITLREATEADQAHILFKAGSGCFANIGFGTGERIVNLDKDCDRATIIHEIGHVVGLLHEQTRSDRDDYVTVFDLNVLPNQLHNFTKRSAETVRDIGDYDYGSIMHYPWYGFSKNCPAATFPDPCAPTILPNNLTDDEKKNFKDREKIMGQRVGLSKGDIDAINTLYPKKAEAPNEPVGIPFNGEPMKIANGDTHLLGKAVAISGDYAIVGAPGFADKESACITERVGEAWKACQPLVASAVGPGDGFGNAVAISGDHAIVGAPGDTTGENGGAVYFFERSAEGWVLIEGIEALEENTDDLFGASVAISGSYAIAGAPGDDDGGEDAGAAHVFEHGAEGWIMVAKLTGFADTRFGHAVALSGVHAIVGAPGDTTGENGGAAYFVERSAEGWALTQSALMDDVAADDLFGSSVAISAPYAIVGAPNDDDGASNAGAAYTFMHTADGWSAVTKLIADDGSISDAFGQSVAISGPYAIVGAPHKALGSSPSNANKLIGAAYVFGPGADKAFVQVKKLLPVDGAFGDIFGTSVAISDGFAVVGVPGDEDVGTNTNAGSVYFYAH